MGRSLLLLLQQRMSENTLSSVQSEKFIDNQDYLQVLQLVLLQEVQPDETAVPASGFSVPAEQKTENFFLTSFDLHLGQFTS